MTRIGYGAALALLAAASATATAQPGKPPGVIQFKQFGATPEQFYQSSLTRWTGQLALDLEAVKAEIATAKVPPVVRAAVTAQADAALRETAELDQLIRRGTPKERLHGAFGDVDKALNGLTAAVNQHPTARLATAPALGRADNAYQQLAAALGTGDNDPARAKRRLIRLGDAIDDNTEELRTLAGDQIPNDRALDRALSAYGREARLLARRVRDDAAPNLVKSTYEAMSERWADAVAQFARVRGLPAPVLAQAVKVDGLHRRAGAVLNLPPFPAGTDPRLPVAKSFAFVVGAAPGGAPQVNVYSDEKGTIAYAFFAYDKAFDGGARVDLADLNGDGVPDLVVSPGPSRLPVSLPVKVFDGRDLHLLVEFVPFPGSKAPLQACGTDLTKDGKALIAVTADGSNHVKVFDLALGKEVGNFFAHDPKVVSGGVRLAWGDVDGDGLPDLLAVNGPGNAVTTVKVFSGKDASVLTEFPVLDNKYRGGAYVAAADLDGNGRANPVIGLDAGSVPLVRIFDSKGKPLGEWLAYDERYRGGVRVAVSARNHVVTGPGPAMKDSPVHIFDAARLKAPPAVVVPFPGYEGGLFVGGR